MTEEQFSALAELLRLRGGKAELAARLVLVSGEQPSFAAKEAGISAQAVSNAVSRVKRGMELAKIAAS